MWYILKQTNTNGVFDPPAIVIAIEADSCEEATLKLHSKWDDIYNDYCPCCGWRWTTRTDSVYVTEEDLAEDVEEVKDFYVNSEFYQYMAESDNVPIWEEVR